MNDSRMQGVGEAQAAQEPIQGIDHDLDNNLVSVKAVSQNPHRRSCYPNPMRRFRDLMALVKIGIVGSNALTALAGFALAAVGEGSPVPWGRGTLAVVGTSLLVGGSCAINNWMDRDIDARMERTRKRPTARGAVSAFQALGMGAGLGAAGLALLFRANPIVALIGLAGSVVYLIPYTLWAKRRAAASLYVGGIAGSVPPLIGWAVVDPRLGGPAWMLFVFLAVWQQAHVRALATSARTIGRRSEPIGNRNFPLPLLRSPRSEK